MKVIRHWWNGSWGRLTRRDVYVRTDGRAWEVEARLGGAEGRSTIRACPDEAAATAIAEGWLDRHFEWRQLPQ